MAEAVRADRLEGFLDCGGTEQLPGMRAQGLLAAYVIEDLRNGELLGGCDIALEMYRNGELKKVLSQAGAVAA